MTYTAPVEAVGAGDPVGRLLRRAWQPVFVARDLRPGKPVPLRVLGEELTLYRAESGRPYIVGARCPHRYTWLHTGFVEGEEIRCFYHGWKFDGVGQCTDQPAEKSSFAAKVRIPSYPAREYAGLVFAWMGPGEPPPLPHFPELAADGVRIVSGIRPPGIWPVNLLPDPREQRRSGPHVVRAPSERGALARDPGGCGGGDGGRAPGDGDSVGRAAADAVPLPEPHAHHGVADPGRRDRVRPLLLDRARRR